MKTIIVELQTGIITKQSDSGGNIEVINKDYDTIYNQPKENH